MAPWRAEQVLGPGRLALLLGGLLAYAYVRSVQVSCLADYELERVHRASLYGARKPHQPMPSLRRSFSFAKFSSLLLGGSLKDANDVLPEGASLKIAVVNTVYWHSEVVFWLAYTLRQLRNVEVSLYLYFNRFGSNEFLERIDSPRRFRRFHSSNFTDGGSAKKNPDVIFFNTCARDIWNAGSVAAEMLRLNPNLKLICVVHRPLALLNFTTEFLPFAKAGGLTFIALAPHVGKYITDTVLPQMLAYSPYFESVTVTWAPATFIYKPGSPCPSDLSEISPRNFGNAFACFNHFVVQGQVQALRRNYSQIFDGLNQYMLKKQDRWATFRLNVLGSVREKFKISQRLLAKKLRFLKELKYATYYEALHAHLALAPAFASDLYFYNVSSSSMAAALIAGVPVIGDRRLLEAYSFFEEDAIFLQLNGETEADAINRIRYFSMADIIEKRKRAVNLNVRLVEGNVELFKSLLWGHRPKLRVGFKR